MKTRSFRPQQPNPPEIPDITGGGRRRGNTEADSITEAQKQKAAREAAIVAAAALMSRRQAREEAERQKRLRKYRLERQAKKMGVCKWCQVPYGVLLEDHKPHCHKRPVTGAGNGNVPRSTAEGESGLPEPVGSSAGNEEGDQCGDSQL